MSSFRSHGTQSSSPKKPSLPVRFIKWTAFQMISFIFAVLLLGVGYAAWTTLSPSQGASGQPVNQTLVQGIINNINDLDSRVTTLITNLSTLSTRVVAINPSGTSILGESIEVKNSGDPTISFHRPGIFASQIKLRSDNRFWFGGWSVGEGQAGIVAKEICLNGDCKSAWPVSTIPSGTVIAGCGINGSCWGGARHNAPTCPINTTIHWINYDTEGVSAHTFVCSKN